MATVGVATPDGGTARAAVGSCRSLWAPNSRISGAPSAGGFDFCFGDAHSIFSWLPNDALAHVLGLLGGRDLAIVTAVCVAWRFAAPLVAEQRLRAWRTLPPGSAALPSWTRSLACHDALTAAVGPRPDTPWWREWPLMRMREMLLSGQGQFAQAERFSAGGELGIAALLRRYAAGLDWMVQAGWSLVDAPVCLLIPAYGSMAIGKALREGGTAESRQLASTVWTVAEALA
eukprot:1194921-Prymnesium_polylepis.1